MSRGLVFGFAAVAIVALVLWLAWPRPPFVQAITVQAGEASRVLAVNGRIRPRLSIDVKSPVPGRVILLPFDVGQRITQGDLIAQVDDAPQLAAIRQAQSLLAAQKEAQAQAQRDLARYERLGADIIGGQRLEQARLAVRLAQDEVQRLGANVEQAMEVRARHQVRAPFSGLITERPVDPGQTVGTDTTLYRLADTQMPEATAPVDELYAADLRVGMAAQVTVPGQQRPLSARIIHMEERVDPATGARAVRLAFDQPPSSAPAGLTVSVNLVVERRSDAISIPRSAILSPSSDPAVRVVKDDGTVADQKITFVDWPSEKVIVTGGLTAGMKVLENPRAAEPGQRVRLAQ